MNCPDCQKNMSSRTTSVPYLCGDGEMCYTLEFHSCKACSISVAISHEHHGCKPEWHIPKDRRPSAAQERTVKMINSVLRLHGDCPTKRSAQRFISAHFAETKEELVYRGQQRAAYMYAGMPEPY